MSSVRTASGRAGLRFDPRYGQRRAGYAYGHTLGVLTAFALAMVVARDVTWPPAAFALVIVIGVIQYRIYFPLHDCSHGSLFGSHAENRFFGCVTGALLFAPFHEFRALHLDHHRLWGTADDPGGVDYFVRFRSRAEMLRFLLLPLVGKSLLVKLKDYHTLLAGQASEPERQVLSVRAHSRTDVAASLGALVLVHLLLLLFLSGGWPSGVWRYAVFVLLPGGTVFLFLSRLRMFLEHTSLDYADFDYLTTPRRTARTIYATPAERLVLCGMNFNYHWEHHAYPGVPSCQLPRLHQEVTRGHIAPTDLRPTYLGALRELWQNLGPRAAVGR